MASIFRDHLLQGRVAFVTGGGSGIGLRMAERFAGQGARVVLAGRRRETLDQAAAGIREAGGTAHCMALDVRDYDAVEAALHETHERYGEVDILLCAAAGNFPAPVNGMSAKGFKAVVDIDLLGTFHACRAAYPWLRKPGVSILCISANQATMPIAQQAHVCAAKAGVEMLTRTLALEWGPDGIRANCVTPGPTDDTEGMRRLSGGCPCAGSATRDELADLALFLCSDAAGLHHRRGVRVRWWPLPLPGGIAPARRGHQL